MRRLLYVACVVLAAMPAVADGPADGLAGRSGTWSPGLTAEGSGEVIAGEVDPFDLLPGRVLTKGELESVSGSLRIFGVEILPKLFRVDRKQRASDASKVHCDVIAQNRADSMGLNTANQDGSRTDYNQAKVSTIYQGFPDSRTTTPAAGSSGYVFTAYGGDMQHLEAYSYGSSDTYTRYWNDSFDEYHASRDLGYLPPGVTDQVFVALPQYGYSEIYYR